MIVAYQSGGYLRRCLAAAADGRYEVVVVDNGSPPGETEALCAEVPRTRLIRLERNRGFGSAANVGVAATSGRWLLLLNPDAWPTGDAIDRLLRFAEEEPRLGAAGPLLFDVEGSPQRSTIRPPLSPAALAIWGAFPGGCERAVRGPAGADATRPA